MSNRSVGSRNECLQAGGTLMLILYMSSPSKATESYEGVVRVKTHPELLQDRQQRPFHVPRDSIVHSLIHRRRLPPVRPCCPHMH